LSTVNVNFAQDIPKGTSEVVVKVDSDADAKAIMTRTPNAYYIWRGQNYYIREANPVHMLPGYIKLTLDVKTPTSFSKDTTLTVIV
jgi:hypothetical protein